MRKLTCTATHRTTAYNWGRQDMVSSRLNYANALLHGTSTGCRWHGTRWPKWWVKLHLPPVPPSCVSSSTGCQFANESPTSWRSSDTRHDLLAVRLTYLISSVTIDQQAHYDHPTYFSFSTGTADGGSVVSRKDFSVSFPSVWNSPSYKCRPVQGRPSQHV